MSKKRYKRSARRSLSLFRLSLLNLVSLAIILLAGAFQPGSQQGALADSARTVPEPPRSTWTWLVVLTALLLALIITLWAVRIALTIPDTQPVDTRPVDARSPDAQPPDAQPPDAHKGHPYMSVDHPTCPTRPLSLPARPVAVPVMIPGPEGLFARLPETPGVGKIRRVMLLPARQDRE